MKTRFLVFAISAIMITSSCYTTRTAGNSGKVPPGQAKKGQERSQLNLLHLVNERNKFDYPTFNNEKRFQGASYAPYEKLMVG
jgi:hypothetical protein